jgi:hypothetical protein
MATAPMQQQVNFTSATSANGGINPAWDFTNTWVMYNGFTYPLLRTFMTPLTVSVASTKAYDGTVSNGSVNYSVTPNTAELFGTLTLAGGGANVGTYTVTPSGLYSNQQGYILSFTGGTITVDPATLSITGSRVITKTYDGTTIATIDVGELVGLVDGETVLVTANGVFSSAAVGSGKSVLVTYTLGGEFADDYILAPQTLLGDIVAAPSNNSLSNIIALVDDSPARFALQSAGIFANVASTIPPLPILSDAGGGALLVFATPSDAGDTAMELPQLRMTMGLGPSDPVSVPVAQSKWVSLLNGGVRLPDGVDQQFFLNSDK